MISGLETASAGTISIGGKVVNNIPPRDRDIALVFQSYALYPHMTVGENMEFSLKLRGASKAEIDAGVLAAAKILGLETYPKALSGGQRQRVAMGRAIVRKPAVFMFDEPLSNLDAQLRVQMRQEIKDLHQRLKTMTTPLCQACGGHATGRRLERSCACPPPSAGEGRRSKRGGGATIRNYELHFSSDEAS